eukprot:maker-scaffold11492_size2010-snap-gene-0.2 protein:Tk08883 transcript:maker-scaffold11492_size2010-snap-gene-0.2-mRNA-1 annotation:"nucleoside diphosphate kinase"
MSESGTCFSVVVGPHGQVSPEADECAASLITDPPPGRPATPYSGTQTYAGWAEAVTTGMCLEVIGGFVEQQPCSQAQADIRIHTRDESYSTVSITDGRCFGTEGPFVAARVSEEECDETPDQLWLIIEAIGGRVQLKNAETGWCMDIYGDSSSAGARLIQWGYGSSPNGTCKPSDQKNNQTFYLGHLSIVSRTLVICKPDAVERGLVGEILSRFERKGLTLAAVELRQLDTDTLDKHYEEHVGKGFYEDLKAFMSRSPAVVAVIEGPEDTFAIVRSMMGPTNPATAPSGTIRGDFGTEMTENLVHGSDSNESAEREIGIFFPGLA